MEVAEQIKKFEEFISMHYASKLLEQVHQGHNFLVVDFQNLIQFDPDLANLLLDQPEEVMKAAEIAVAEFDLPKPIKDFKIRFQNLPETQRIMVREIRSTHIGKLIFAMGIVRQKSDVRPQVTSGRFECPSCGNVISVLQLEQKFREPSRCGCGRKGKFRLLSKELVDAQRIVLEEAMDELEGGEQPKRMDIFLKQDLVSLMTDKKTNPGTKILVSGIVKEVPITLKEGGQSIRYDLLIEANNVEAVEEDFGSLQITEEEMEAIKKIAADKEPLKKLVRSLAPTINGHDQVKEAIVFMLVGGCMKISSDGSKRRGDIHVLLIGDPGAGKSQLLKRAQLVAPKSRYVTGKGVSGAGLTAAVVRDEFLKGWALEAGALVLANHGIVMIDELDKMSKEDRSAMHEALEQQTVSISKANIQATLRCETTVLAAANPKFGRFDPYELIAKQIDLPPALINRFDLIFPIKDLPSKEKDEQMAGFILKLHQTIKEKQEVEIETPLLRKYIAYARRRCNPHLSDEAVEEMKEYYVSMRMSGQDDSGIKSIPITARQLEALVRLAEAHAKIRLSDQVLREDAKKAIELVDYCLRQVGLDKETGKIDIDRISTGITASQRNKIVVVKEIINELEKTKGKTVAIEDIIKEGELKGQSPESTEEVLEKLKRSGDIFEPKRGFITRI
ncbi:TPA: minichromosome maintenance protein MCM [Candidatus Woesearchaeota archaeon]|nr:minichromosome maintenance protein MCM [Candidatus Woesearchaeota archaeon]HII88637.1 minichromosome maintenance protein MCM [Candidatus Woesearchaeota archaeon]